MLVSQPGGAPHSSCQTGLAGSSPYVQVHIEVNFVLYPTINLFFNAICLKNIWYSINPSGRDKRLTCNLRRCAHCIHRSDRQMHSSMLKDDGDAVEELLETASAQTLVNTAVVHRG